MILYFADRNMDIIGTASTELSDAYVIMDDTKKEDIDNGVSTFEGRILFKKDNRLDVEKLVAVGNTILRYDSDDTDSKSSYVINGFHDIFTIIEAEVDSLAQTVYFYAEDGGLDLLNDIVGAYSAVDQPVDTYVQQALTDTGFTFVNNVSSDDAIRLSLDWTDKQTVMSRLQDIASYFNYEFSFGYTISGMTITNRWVEFTKERGIDTKEVVSINRNYANILVRYSIANLATALYPVGSDGLTLDGFSYDDGQGDIHVSGPYLMSENALGEWGRFTLQNDSEQGHLFRLFSCDATTQQDLFDQALVELKKRIKPEVNYEIDNLQLPPGVGIGDRINVVEDDGEIYVSGRILKLDTSVTQNTKQVTLGEWKIKTAGISERVMELAKSFKEIAENRNFYTWIVYADDKYGHNMSKDSTNKEYIGISANHLTEDFDISKVKAEDFVWSKIMAEDGASVVDARLFYKQTDTEPPKPTQDTEGKTIDQIINTVPTGWSETEPGFDVTNPDTNLYKTVRIVYSDGTVQYNRVTIEAAFEAVKAVRAEFQTLIADYAKITELEAAKARIGDLEADHVSVTDFEAEQGYIDQLQANTADIATIRANSAKVKDLTAQQLTAATGYIGDLTSNNITANDIVTDHATVGNLDTNYAKINLANVNNAWITNGVIKDAAISDAQIIGVSANKLTAGTIDASKITVTNLNADNLTVGTINGARIGNGSLDLSKLAEEVPTKEYLDNVAENLQGQIDGQIETWTGTVVPTLNNTPASSWKDDAKKLKAHVGDIYYVVNAGSEVDGYTYRFTETKSGSSTTYSWTLIKDNQVTKALQELVDVKGDISGIKQFDSEISSWKTDTDEELSSLKGRTSTLETDMGNKVSTTTFNELKQTVDENSASITSLSETVDTKADGSTVTKLSNTVNNVKQTADNASLYISNLTTTLGTNADGTTKDGDIVKRTTAVETGLSGITTRVGKTEAKLAGHYAESTTAAGTAAKAAKIKPDVTGWELYSGATVTVKFSTANTATAPTLNVNSTGAKTIKSYTGANLSEGEYKWAAGAALTFVYNGSNWLMQDSGSLTRLKSAETTITQTANNVLIKATESDTTAAQGGAHVIESLINVATSGVTIAAEKVNIAGAAIFTSGRLSESSLSNAYDAKGAAAAVQTNLDNLEIGGRNLASKANIVGFTTTWTETDYVWQGLAGKGAGLKFPYTMFEVGESYVLSYKLKKVSGTLTGIGGHCGGFTCNAFYVDGVKSDHLYSRGEAIADDTNVHTVNVYLTYNGNSSDNNLYIQLNRNSYISDNNTTVQFWDIQIEKGNKATDWTPAPEDQESYADSAAADALADSKTYADNKTSGLAAKGDAIARQQTIYYRKTSSGAPAANTTWLATSGTGYGNWSTRIPQLTNGTTKYPYLYVATQTQTVAQKAAGTTCTCSAVLLDDSTTIIDGGNIITGTVDANQIAAGAITAEKLDATTINASKKLTVGAMTAAEQKKILNSEIEVGGRNLLTGTAESISKATTETAGYVTRSLYYTPNKVMLSDLGLKVGDEVTLSFDWEVTNASVYGNARIEWYGYKSDSAPDGYIAALVSPFATFSASNTSGHFVKTVELTAATIKAKRILLRIDNSKLTLTISNCKLEKGNKATDWSPAPEDLAATATNYITADSSGIKVHNAGDSSNYAHITSNGMDVIKGGDIVASFGSTARVGATNSGHVSIASSGIDLSTYDNNAEIVLAHIGYDSTRVEGDNETAPYYTFGRREGSTADMIGGYSFSEGHDTKAAEWASHAEGEATIADDYAAHAEGVLSAASGYASHAQNIGTIASGHAQTAIGSYNIEDSNGEYAFIIGNGASEALRSNALTVDWRGNVDIVSGAKYKINGTALSAADVGAVPTTRKVNNKALSADITLSASDVGAPAKTAVTPSAFFARTTHTVLNAQSIAGSGYKEGTVNVTKSGYFPLGIVGWVRSGSGSSFAAIYDLNLSAAAAGSATIDYGVRNYATSAMTLTLKADILWAKVL